MRIEQAMLELASPVLLVTLLGFATVRAFTRVRRGFAGDVKRALEPLTPRRWIVGGMMGAGKTTFARTLAAHLGLTPIEIDLFPSEADVLRASTQATAGWVAEANPWQLPAVLAREADVVVFLDYANTVNYVRLCKRGFQEWRARGSFWASFKQIMIDRTLLDLGRIVFRYGSANRRGWRETGLVAGMDPSAPSSIHCISPAELALLFDLAVKGQKS